MNGQFKIASEVVEFLLAGNATFTLVSKISGTRFTYRARQPEGEEKAHLRFVQVLTGADNESDYRFLGTIFVDAGSVRSSSWPKYKYSHKSKIGSDAPSAKAFAWFMHRIDEGTLTAALERHLEVWHEGRCGRCGRKLTVPESVASGFGPECAQQLGIVARASMNLF